MQEEVEWRRGKELPEEDFTSLATGQGYVQEIVQRMR